MTATAPRTFALALAAVFTLAAAPHAPAAAPAHPLPRYDLEVTLPADGPAAFRMAVTWTNPTPNPLPDIVFNFYPHYRVPAEDTLLLAKTLELLRLQPSYGIDRKGQHGAISSAKVVARNGKSQPPSADLPFRYEANNLTALHFTLPQPVPPGESVTVELAGTIDLPAKQGRWGRWQGVTYLTNALPVVAFCDAAGWRPVPFVPWHQPWFNEAGVYRARVTLPADQVLACPAAVRSERPTGGGMKVVETEPFTGRDFSLLCSARYREFKSNVETAGGKTVELRCLAFPEHAFYANEILKNCGEAIATFSQWLGPYPYPQFTVAESFFGWNGNECAGMVLIDERVFGMPELAAGYFEYLISHETCHQWWYNLVGTNGYAESFLDEGAATYFTHRYLDRKRGKNNAVLTWPTGLGWLPNINRENYRFSSMVGAIRRGEMRPAAQELPQFGHLVGLFTGAYDRGSKVFGMVEDRLGEAAFMEFTRGLVEKYRFRVLQAADLRRELEAYTGRDWGDFFTQWVYGKGMTDWEVAGVKVADADPLAGPRVDHFARMPKPGTKSVSVLLRQNGEITEPTWLGVQFAKGEGEELRVPVGPAAGSFPVPGGEAKIEPLADGVVRVTLTLPREPDQITVDPDKVLLDADPGNNHWKSRPRLRLTPLYTTLEETDLTTDYDRWNLTAGPWFYGPLYPDPWYVRSTMIGVRAGAYKTQVFSGGAYAAYRTEFRDAVIGVDGLFDHWPFPKTQVGFNYERRILEPIGTDAPSGQNRGVVYGRYVFQYGSSMYLPPMHYAEAFASYTDNFLPFARTRAPGASRPQWWQLTGVHYRLNLYTPYWDPEGGVWIDAAVGGGATRLNQIVGTYQAKGELAGVQKLPDELGPFFGQMRVAGRMAGQWASPDRGQFYALGGGTLFRGFDLAERQGNALWVGNLELRVPLVRDAEWDVLDHVFGGRNLWAVGFYDVGEVYAAGRSVGGVAHALGGGLRLDIALFSFIERATLRIDAAKTINANTPFQFWFGVQQAF